MAITRDHEIHHRRLGRNVGLAVVLAAFVALVFGLTVVKVERLGEEAAAGNMNAVPSTGLRP